MLAIAQANPTLGAVLPAHRCSLSAPMKIRSSLFKRNEEPKAIYRGPQRMAQALVVLMDRLGYSKYGIQGGDWGSAIAQDMACQAPVHVVGLHLNLLFVRPANPEAVVKMSDAERKRYSYFDREESSFFFLQASEPQTLAYSLTDSPVGWLPRHQT
jgi:pimeloyl-ACP methyl ester carboxylesterase